MSWLPGWIGRILIPRLRKTRLRHYSPSAKCVRRKSAEAPSDFELAKRESTNITFATIEPRNARQIHGLKLSRNSRRNERPNLMRTGRKYFRDKRRTS
jgi:hypothetical protein